MHEGCLACLGYTRQLVARRQALDGAGVGIAVVLRGELARAAEWRARMSPAARVLADSDGWSRRMLDRMVGRPEAPASSVRDADEGVALLVVNGAGRVLRMASGPEAGHLPDPAVLEDAVGLEAVRHELADEPDAADRPGPAGPAW